MIVSGGARLSKDKETLDASLFSLWLDCFIFVLFYEGLRMEENERYSCYREPQETTSHVQPFRSL
jgi:hypothetical protein